MLNIKRFLFWLLAIGLIGQEVAQAQILPITYGSSPVAFGVDANGLLSDTGVYGTGTLGLSGAGTRMFWYPGKAAFRAGYVDGTQWDDASIGVYSIALGYDTTASAYGSLALGWNSNASAPYATALGYNTTASGWWSSALGFQGTSSGPYATTFGYISTASGFAATASGEFAVASGDYSNTWGNWTVAAGDTSTAFGKLTTAVGAYSTSSGFYTQAQSYESFVVGQYNIGGGTAASWVSSEPLFEAGNGTPSTPSDALVVYKNGNVTAGGVITAQPGGDIPMYSGN